MRKLIAILITLGMMTSSSFAAFDGTSFRIQGMNPFLAGIVADEYTDMWALPADILAINGYRFYTQFANLSGKGDRLFNDTGVGQGGIVSDDAFQFGFVGQPLKNLILPNSQMGIFLEQSSRITAGNPGAFAAGGDGEATNSTTVNTDNSATPDNDFADTGDTTVVTSQYGKREIETGENDLALIFGHPIGESLWFGIGINSDITTSEEPINAKFDLSNNVIGTGIDTENNTQVAQEDIDMSSLDLDIGARLFLGDRLNIGAAVGFISESTERKRSSSVTRNMNLTANAGGGNTSTLVATGPEISDITAALGAAPAINTLVPALNALFNTNDAGTTLASAGFAWSNGQALINDGNFDPDAVGKREDDGTGTGVAGDTYYSLNDETTLFGAVYFVNFPMDVDVSATNNVTATVQNWDAANVDRIVTINNSTTYTGSGDDKTTQMGVTIGAEQNLPGKVKLAYGLVYGTQDTDEDITYTEAISMQVADDATGDGLNLGAGTAAGDSRVTISQTDKYQGQTETEVTTYDFPIGFELQPFKKLKIRLGVTHHVQEVVTKVKAKRLEDGLWTIVTEAGGAAAVTTLGGGTATTGDVNDDVTTTTNKIRWTQYYYGAGYQWSENLSFDILNFSGTGTGAGLLDLGSWRIGATLLFGGQDDMGDL